jgi:hypothetical protein
VDGATIGDLEKALPLLFVQRTAKGHLAVQAVQAGFGVLAAGLVFAMDPAVA